jgi:hypothetical protein
MLSIDVGNANLWEIRWSLQYSASPPIQHQDCPFLIQSPVIAIFCENPVAKPTWFFGGYLKQMIATGITLGGLSDAEQARKKVFLNKLQVIAFEFDVDYKISFHPAPWHSSIKVNIWEYTGEINKI